VESRKPKIGGAIVLFSGNEGCEFPLTWARNRIENRIERRTVAEITFIGLLERARHCQLL
jgi:hypothetical protein